MLAHSKTNLARVTGYPHTLLKQYCTRGEADNAELTQRQGMQCAAFAER
jgi:hypothetical protein